MIPFTKAHACGNDFLIVERGDVDEAAQRETARRLCARNTGIGADGIEYFNWTGERSGRITLYNADGSVAEISGNGTRCVAAWMAHEKGAAAGETLTIATEVGVRECRIIAAEDPHFRISSRMGVPTVEARSVTLASGERVEGAVVSTGNPHFVIFLENAVVENVKVENAVVDNAGADDAEFVVRPAFLHGLRVFDSGHGPSAGREGGGEDRRAVEEFAAGEEIHGRGSGAVG